MTRRISGASTASPALSTLDTDQAARSTRSAESDRLDDSLDLSSFRPYDVRSGSGTDDSFGQSSVPRRLGRSGQTESSGSLTASKAGSSIRPPTGRSGSTRMPTTLTTDRLNLSEDTIVGREEETALLQGAFRKAVGAPKRKDAFPELVMVHGMSGVGKTSLVAAALNKSNMIFLGGKFDLQSRSTPYAAFVSAFSGLIAQIQAKKNGDAVREAINMTVGNARDAAVLVRAIPSLIDVLDYDPTEDAEANVEGGIGDVNRLHFVFRNLVRAIGGSIPGCPLVLFVDDLQWIDNASLKLLESVASCRDMPFTMIIGTYRDNEVDKDHGLTKMLLDINAKKEIVDISLSNLSSSDVSSLVATALGMDAEEVKQLSTMVETKTLGNPFFAVEFLRTIFDEDILTFNIGSFKWMWDEEQIESQFVTDNVADLLKRRLLTMPKQVQDILLVASALGNEFEDRVLEMSMSAIAPESEGAHHGERTELIAASLQEAVDGGILRRTDSSYGFIHDQLQQASFDLCPEEHKNEFQANIGRSLIDNAEEGRELESLLLIAVDLCNCDTASFSGSNCDKIRLANLNLRAGIKSVKQAGFIAAGEYLETGINILRDVSIDDNLQLYIDLHRFASQAHYSSGNFDKMDVCLDAVLERTDLDIMDKLPLYIIRCHALYASYKLTESLALSQQVLEEMGYKRLPDKASTFDVVMDLIKTKRLLKKHTGKIPELPLMEDEKRVYAMTLYHTMGSTLYMLGSSVLPILILRWTRWALKYGLTGHSCTAIVFYAFMITSMGDLEGGREYGEVTVQMLERLGDAVGPAIGRCLFLLENSIAHWTKPVHLCIKPSVVAYEVAMRVGDTESAMWGLWCEASFSHYSAKKLSDVDELFRSHMLSCREYELEGIWATSAVHRQQILNLMGRGDDPLILTGDVINEEDHLAWAQNGNMQMVITVIYNVRIEQAYYFHEYEKAAEFFDCFLPGEKTYPGSFFNVRNALFEGLVSFAMASIKDHRHWMKRGSSVLKKVRKWVKAGNPNCVHMLSFLQAEEALARGRMKVAETKYGETIVATSRNGIASDKALAHERYCAFFLKKGDKYWARHHVEKAIQAYKDWEAHAKVDHLVEKYRAILSQVK